MKLFLSLFMLVAVSAAADIVNTWNYVVPMKLVRFNSGKGHSFSHAECKTTKTPDGKNTMRLVMTATVKDSPAYRKQMVMLWSRPVNKGAKYRISFYYKGSVSGEITFNASENVAPYRGLGKHAGKRLSVKPQWKRCSFEFEANRSFIPPLAMPRFMFGQYPDKGVLYIGPVTLERLNPVMPLALSSEWNFHQGVSSQNIVPDKTTMVKLNNNALDIARLAGGVKPGKTVTLYNWFTANRDGMMQVGMAADWYFECYVNGKKIYSTMKRGNVSHDFIPQDNVFNFPVTKGKNLLCVRVKSGSKGWRFVCGTVKYVANPLTAKLFSPKASPEYRPVNKDKFLVIKPGSALDFSGIVKTPIPASRGGRLIVNSSGRFAFENDPNVPVRFMAFNWTPGNWRYAVHKWTHKDVDRFTDAIVRRGYNMVRFHFVDMFLIGYRIHNRPHKKLSEVKIPQTPTEMDLDPHNLDIFDYLIASFKKRGIYINLDLMSSRAGYTLAYPSEIPHEKSFKTGLFTKPVYRKHWKAAVTFLMQRKNPYTGQQLKDEPTIACVNFLNEQDLRLANGLKFFNAPFKQYLKQKYKTNAVLAKAWKRNVTFETVGEITEEILRGDDTAARDAGDFLIGAMVEMSGWFYKTLRGIGYPGLVTHWDMIMRMLEVPARSRMPVIAQHTYFAHPGKVPLANIVKKSRSSVYAGNYKYDTTVDQHSSLNSSYFRAATAARFLDRPYMITEYSHSAFNKYRHERGLYFGSYAALQGWDTLTAHANTVRLKFDPFLKFENGLDPISVASEAVTTLTFLRGDVKEAPHSVELKLNRAMLFPKNYLCSIGDDYAKLALVTKIGMSYSEGAPFTKVGKAHPTIVIEPKKFAFLKVSQWYVQADAKGAGGADPLYKLLRQRNILPKNNLSNPSKRLFQSETGELTLESGAKAMQVVTPRLEGAIIKRNKPVKMSAMSINSCSVPASITAASLNSGDTLRSAKHILLIVATNAFNTGMIFDSPKMRICYESGNAPTLIQSVKAKIILDTANNSIPKVYALNMDGSRESELPVRFGNGRVILNLDTSKLKYGTPYFEIVYQ